jgi:hypothetical protein
MSPRRKRIKLFRWARRNELMVVRGRIDYRPLWAHTNYNELPNRYRLRSLPKGWEPSMFHDAYIYTGKL